MRQPETGSAWIYAGFWIRVWASIIDSALLLLLVFPLLSLIPGAARASRAAPQLFTASGRINFDALALAPPGPLHVVLYWLLPAVVVVIFWLTREATPGKMAIGARVVDADTGERLRPGQSIRRYLGYYVSTLPFGLGLIWVGIDSRKQGWHDKIAGSVVVRRRRTVEPVRFEAADDASNPQTGWNNE
ncbi:RDD family protein [Salinisphaera sp. RV14]|uniref:RDD family protein n=1 Tax=Salinisphaera sp. RV14 TaxID=3454140 RepID=UPI003F853FC9